MRRDKKTLVEMRCKCGKLLSKHNIADGTVQIKCPNCGHMNTITITTEKPYQERIPGKHTK